MGVGSLCMLIIGPKVKTVMPICSMQSNYVHNIYVPTTGVSVFSDRVILKVVIR